MNTTKAEMKVALALHRYCRRRGHCTAPVLQTSWVPYRPEFFFNRPYFQYNLRSVHYYEDRFHINNKYCLNIVDISVLRV